MGFFAKFKIPEDEVLVLQYDCITKAFQLKMMKKADCKRITATKSGVSEYYHTFGERVRRLFSRFCLRLGTEADKSSFEEDFIDEDMIAKPQRMTAARWRARFGEDELVLLAEQAERTPPPSPADDEYCEVVGKVNDAWLLIASAEVHAPPAAAAGEEEEEELPPCGGRRRVCRRRWLEKLAEETVVRPRVGRAHRLHCR